MSSNDNDQKKREGKDLNLADDNDQKKPEGEDLNLTDFLKMITDFVGPAWKKLTASLKEGREKISEQLQNRKTQKAVGQDTGAEKAGSALSDTAQEILPEDAGEAVVEIPSVVPKRKRKRKKVKINYRRFLTFLLIVFLILFLLVKGISSKVEKIRKEEALRTEIMNEAAEMASGYDYSGAIDKLRTIEDYEDHKDVMEMIIEYKHDKRNCVAVSADQVVHVFYHSLVVDTDRAFKGDGSDGFKQWMTTVSEFNKITEAMYKNGYVLVDIRNFVQEVTDEDGDTHFTEKSIYLPKGKKPFVLSLDDLSYYHSYDDKGTASKLVLDDDGKITCEYIKKNGDTVEGAYDCVPLMNQFLEKHPDGAYQGSRGIIALTGYNGIFGYRTDKSYVTQQDIDEDKQAWLEDNPDYDYDKECKEAKKIAKELKAEGWTFASHTWGHLKAGDISLETLKSDTEKWLDNVAPLIGGSDMIIFAHGSDLATSVSEYDESDKFKYLKRKGFDYYMNVYSGQEYTLEIKKNFIHDSRMNLDGYRLWNEAKGKTSYTENLFNAKNVLDPARKDMPELTTTS